MCLAFQCYVGARIVHVNVLFHFGHALRVLMCHVAFQRRKRLRSQRRKYAAMLMRRLCSARAVPVQLRDHVTCHGSREAVREENVKRTLKLIFM